MVDPGEPVTLDLSRALSVRALVRASGGLYRRFPVLFLALALCVIAPWDLVLLAITGRGPFHHGAESAGTYVLVEIVRTSLITPLVSALHMHAVVTSGRGERPRLASVALQGLRVLPVVAAASIISGLGIALGYLAFVLPGIVLSLRWAVVAQVAAVEPVDWTEALGRSRALTRENYAHVLGVILLVGLINGAVTLGARAVSISAEAPAAVALGIAADTLLASFAALATALLYFDLLARAGAPARPPEHRELRDVD
ncbi:MAG: hypothetical protein ACYDC2_12410 [Solirubrobacteraceae bacterium]